MSVFDILAKADSCPDIRFKPNTTLRTLTDAATCSSLISTEKLADDSIANQLKQIECLLQSNGDTAKLINMDLESLILPVSGALEKSFMELNTVKKQVDDLSVKINVAYEAMLAINPLTSIHLNRKSTDLKINKIAWNNLEQLGHSTESLIDIVHAVNGINKTTPTQPIIDLISARLQSQTKFTTLDADLSEECIKETMKATLAACKDQNIEQVKQCIRTVFDTTAFTKFCSKIIDNTNGKVNPTYATVEFLNIIGYMPKIMKTIGKCIPTGSVEAIDNIMERLDVIKNHLEFAGYVVNHHRTSTFKDSLVVFNNHSSKDPRSSYESLDNVLLNDDIKMTCSVQDIAHHLEYYFKGSILPVVGVKQKAITDSMETIKNNVVKNVANLETRIKFEENRLRKDAILFTLSKESIGCSNPKINPKEFISQVVGYGITSNQPTEDILYNVIIGMQHKNTLTDVLYKDLKAEYTKMATESNAISEEDIALAESKVAINFVSNYLCKKYVEPK